MASRMNLVFMKKFRRRFSKRANIFRVSTRWSAGRASIGGAGKWWRTWKSGADPPARLRGRSRSGEAKARRRVPRRGARCPSSTPATARDTDCAGLRRRDTPAAAMRSATSSTPDSTSRLGIGHLSPKFRSTTWALETGGQRCQRIQNQKMGADVRRVPVVFVRNKNRARLLFRQDFSDDFDSRPPRRALFPARNRIDIIPIRHRQAEAEEIARAPQFTQARRAPRDFAAQCHGNVDDVPLRFPQQPQRQSADDALVVRVRRENQCFRRVVRPLWMSRKFWGTTRRQLFSVLEKAGRVQKQIFGTGSQIQLR